MKKFEIQLKNHVTVETITKKRKKILKQDLVTLNFTQTYPRNLR